MSAVITFHREGLLAHTTLLSIERCRRFAEEAGLSVEFVITLDNADVETLRVVKGHQALRPGDQLHEVDYRDLSTCRNHAIQHARGRYIGTFDGDDYFSANWIARCVELIRQHGEKFIYHPEIMFAFGAWNAYWWQVDQLDEYYRPGALLITNYWNACAFAARSVFERCPYHVSRVGEAGFGFEDWHWNCETIAHGFVHRLARGTVRFERRKHGGSLNIAHQQVGAVIRPSIFFEQL
ncbi:glycosyltransferase family 2 protein [Mizugakiibacter sediminis]|uniref:glycosyltransferase family 2 protein n=1 Tax=Mizugakiibacter sediminis TaxID=1475481 RepID=UPI001650EB0F|nr:glycosyltransferase [Mizugakiibacter sediminis]